MSVLIRAARRSTIGTMPSSRSSCSGNASGATSCPALAPDREQPHGLGKVGVADVRVRPDQLDLAQRHAPEVDRPRLLVQAREHDPRAGRLGDGERLRRPGSVPVTS